MLFFNVFALLRLMKYVKYVLSDFIGQTAETEQPSWDESVDIMKKCR